MTTQACPSLQIVSQAFASQNWKAEALPEQSVVCSRFDTKNTVVDLHVQVFPEINALSVVGETLFPIELEHVSAILRLLSHANKKLTLGFLEYDIERQFLSFRLSNLFGTQPIDPEIIIALVHMSIIEVDRIFPYANIVRQTNQAELAELNLPNLLDRQDLMPAVEQLDYQPKTEKHHLHH